MSRLESPVGEAHPPRDIAIAILLLECARADFEHSAVEIDEVRGLLTGHLAVAPAELDRLLGDAGRAARDTVSLHGPISRLNAEMSATEKRELMGWLWRVAHADGRIDVHEEHLLRKLSDLLHIPHADFIRTKLEVQANPPA
ncbi:MAG: TerB family tellurite resistance protein [Panacagrimonas sp.]